MSTVQTRDPPRITKPDGASRARWSLNGLIFLLVNSCQYNMLAGMAQAFGIAGFAYVVH